MSEIATHPVQRTASHIRERSEVPQAVSLRAYEVYRHVYGEQEALVTGRCRGGFSAGELIAYLYARSFPKDEWRQRVGEAMNGMKHL